MAVEGPSKKEKGLVDMDSSLVIAGGEEYKRIDGNGKYIIKNAFY